MKEAKKEINLKKTKSGLKARHLASIVRFLISGILCGGCILWTYCEKMGRYEKYEDCLDEVE